MEFRILGPLEVVDGDAPVMVGARKQRMLLALLVVHANRVVTSDQMLEELWGDDAAGKENALWVYISRLRSALGEREVLFTRDHGYSLVVDEGDLDYRRFESEVEAGRALIKSDPAAASNMLGQALDLWRGPALEEFAFEDFAQPERTRLEELRAVAIGDRVEADLRRGMARELVGELEALQQAHPTQERVVGQLMLALYRSGRQSDALRVFERFRLYLGEELGLDPSPELRLLEEQILLHDSRIQLRGQGRSGGAEAVSTQTVVNPYKGLRAFFEDDTGDFHGRSRVVADVIRRLDADSSLLGLVGPSGSGKSSIVRAGVIPALRKGAISGSEDWLFAQMVPGVHPFAELEAALLRSSLDAPDSLSEQLADEDSGVLRAILRVLPRDNARLVLVIDQFEELFTLVDDEIRTERFLAGLLDAVQDPHQRVKVIFTLRADFYDRPLAYPEFGMKMGDGIVNIVPLTADELEAAARLPAEAAGITLEPALVAALLTDVVGQPGGLPLFQYALTELFERRDQDTLTLASYLAMDGVQGALSRRADDLYSGLSVDEQMAARQLFLRLVTIADGDQWGRRRVPASEVLSLDIDVVALEAAIDVFTAHRLLTVDRDAVTRSPTVEVAHEALLRQWHRLREWIEEAREDVKRNEALSAAMVEWSEAERNPDYLLSGARLVAYEQWAETSTMKLTRSQIGFIGAGGDHRDETETDRLTREAASRRSARRPVWVLVAVVLVVGGLAGWLFFANRPSDPARVAVFTLKSTAVDELLDTGLVRAEREFDVEVENLAGRRTTNLTSEYQSVLDSGADLILVDDSSIGAPWLGAMAGRNPDTDFVSIAPFVAPARGVISYHFADEQVGFLAGAAAALASKTGVIGYLGAIQFRGLEEWRAGFEAGAIAIEPSIQILSAYSSSNLSLAFESPDRGREVALDLYRRGADVVMYAAGNQGGIEAAWQHTRDTGDHVWAIGADSDWALFVSETLRPHVLTSAIKKFDVAAYEIVRQHLGGEIREGGYRFTIDDGAIGLAPTDHLSEAQLALIEDLSDEVIGGARVVPRLPSGDLLTPLDVDVASAFTVEWDGRSCRYLTETTTFVPGTAVSVELVNLTSDEVSLLVFARGLPLLQLPAGPLGAGHGYMTFEPTPLSYEVNCGLDSGRFAPWTYSRHISTDETVPIGEP